MAELSTERIDALLSDLDFIAREYDMYEYGLPMHGADDEDGPINKLRAAVRQWAAAGVTVDRTAQPSLDGVEPVSDADNQWFGDMMILQVLADSDNVNEQEREVLTRWMAASDRPTNSTNGVMVAQEALPDEWNEAQRICDLPAVDEAITALIDDPTGDNATCVVRAVLRAIGVAPSDDTARLDYLQRTGSTLEILPGTARGARFRFRVGGLHAAVSDDLRAAIDTAAGVEVDRG